jgi:hypothetical protein
MSCTLQQYIALTRGYQLEGLRRIGWAKQAIHGRVGK